MKNKSGIIKKLIVAGIAALLALLLSPAYMNSSRPTLLCVACHEMRGPYLSWRTSTHRADNCSGCHSVPSSYRMISGHVFGPSVAWEKRNKESFKKCVQCHKKVSGTVYFHSIKFPHGSHQKNISDCRFCHKNVVHGSRIEYRNAPTKKSCFTCHDDKKASRKCNLCHLTFTKNLPQQLDPNWIASHKSDVARFKRACSKCHDKKFCGECHRRVNPHDKGWIKSHKKTAGKSTSRCQICHSHNDCTKCHNILNQHKDHWYDGHRTMARKSKTLCNRCHDKKFCDYCHSGINTHPDDWLKKHRAMPESKSRTTCAACHTEHYCENCHGGKPTLHHKGNWLSNHGAEVSTAGGEQKDIEACISCHVPNFCLSCHRGVRKNVHSRNYTTMHKNTSPKSMAQCKTCHSMDSCNSCHKTSLPATHKDPLWKQGHGMSAVKNMDACTVCHESAFCESCHSRKVPVSHEKKEVWLKNHGVSSRDSEGRCSLCHDDRYCNTCHRRNKPPDHYRDIWPQTHGHAAMSNMNSCLVCHDKKDCRKCHGENRAHNIPGWMKNHDVSHDNQSFAKCASCHWLGTCVDCHQNAGLKGHADCTSCHLSMTDPKKLKQPLCVSCHKDQPSKGVHAKHDSLDCAYCHKQHGFKAAASVCSECHSMDKDHTGDTACTECHSFK